MKMLVYLSLVVLLGFTMDLPGCLPVPADNQVGPTTRILEPADGAQFSVKGPPIQIYANSADPKGVSWIHFYVDGRILGPNENAQLVGSGVSDAAWIEWTPPTAGTYTLSANAGNLNNQVGPMVSVQIVVQPLSVDIQCALVSLASPDLVLPADNSTLPAPPKLYWDYVDHKCHPQSYQIQISEDAAFSKLDLEYSTQDYTETSRQLQLPSGRCYYWRVLASVPGGKGLASPARRFCIAAAGAAAAAPSLTLNMNANCREGPGKAYPSVDAFLQGQILSITGRSEDAGWWLVARPGGGGSCWVAASLGSLSGDGSGVPLVAAPPLPPTEPAPAAPAVDTPLPADSTPPEITNVAVNPGSIEKDGCGSPNTFTLSATVSDASGVAQVSFHLLGPYPQDTADGSLSPVGGDTYQAVIGPLADTGNWLVYVGASDVLGNSTQLGPWSLQVVCMQ
jgi:hypothetical protein